MSQDLSQWFEDDLLPAVFENLPSVFPEFGWKKVANGWGATKDTGLGRPERVVCRRPFGFYVHGGEAQSWLAYMNAGTFPKGEEWLRAVKELAKRVGKGLPERDLSPDARAKMETRKKGRDLVEEVVTLCHRLLLDAPEAEEARTYLEARGLPRDRWEVWELGFMPEDTPLLVQGLEAKGWKWEEAKAALLEAGLLKEEDRRGLRVHLHGRVVAPWRGSGESILGWWGRKLSSAHPDAPKYLYTPGTWRSRPYLLDRSRREDRLLLVEGVLDAIQCREHGFPAVALGGVGLDAYLLPLKASSPAGVVLVMDPDEAGQKAARSSVAKLLGAGLSVFMLELPKGEKGAKGDPDEFLRAQGPDAFRRLVEDAPAALRWKARDILATHGAAGWKDQTIESAIREAQLFAGKLPPALHPFLPSLFWEELAQEIALSPETMQEVTQALHEEWETETRKRETRAKVQETAKKLEKLLDDGRPEDAHKVLLADAAALQELDFNAPRVAPRVALDEMEELRGRLNKTRGGERMGMALLSEGEGGRLVELDQALVGLRGLMLLAGPPGCGKTSLAFQIGLEAVEADEEAAMVILSLEQSRFEHLSRALAYFSGLEWQTVTMGSFGCRTPEHRRAGSFFKPLDAGKLEAGEAKLKTLGGRLLILDDENFPTPTAETILREVEKLKAKTGASKVLVVVDYLQLWPVPLEQAKAIRTDLDRDKWQIGELKKLKNRMGAEDAVLVISEAKKEDWKEGLGMGSVMGSARGTYTPDVVMVLQPLSSIELVPEADMGSEQKRKKATEEGHAKRAELAKNGRTLEHLEIVKGRDGVQRRAFDMTFHFRTLRFEETPLFPDDLP
jgi:DNA primase catalytic core